MKESQPDNTFYWNDYETFGIDPTCDRAAQFAGVRTDEDLNVIEEPLVIYCQPAHDMLPDPEACLVTGITPQKALEHGVPEPEFISRIHDELSRAGTCGVGYNSIRFDDEFTRYTLYRNFFDPYEREWKNGNSRWDIIDMLRLARALRPKGIEWPTHPNGRPSFKLEHLATANGISHNPHDALSDVHATIELAKRIKTHQPKLYQYVHENRNKHSVARQINIFSKSPLLHVSRMYPAESGCIAMVAPVTSHPTNQNGIIVYDLSVDPNPLLTLSVEDIRERVFTPADKLPEGIARIPLKTIHLNKCPVVAPCNTLKLGHSELVEIDVPTCLAHGESIKHAKDLNAKIWQVFKSNNFEKGERDPDHSLYSGFFKDDDKAKMKLIRSQPADKLGKLRLSFRDPRIPELLFRYRARNYPETLSSEENTRWEAYRMTRLTHPDGGAGITFKEYQAKINELRAHPDSTAEHMAVLDALESYGKRLVT